MLKSNLKKSCKIDDLPENIVHLKALTSALEFAGIVKPTVAGQVKELIMDAGTSYMVGLYKNSIMAVARNFASDKCRFPEHTHDEWELLVVYEGEMHLTVENKKVILGPKGFYYILPNQKHSGTFSENTWFLAITMPASESWPEGG